MSLSTFRIKLYLSIAYVLGIISNRAEYVGLYFLHKAFDIKNAVAIRELKRDKAQAKKPRKRRTTK